MDEQRLRAEMGARDRATLPADSFSEQLFARLMTEVQAGRGAAGKARRPFASPRRWLPAIGLVLLSVATVGALAFLMQPDDDRLACTPELAAVAAQQLRESDGYTYRLEGWLETPYTYHVDGRAEPRQVEVVIDGEVAADAAREQYVSGGQLAFGPPDPRARTDAAIQITDTLWLRNHMGVDADRPWMRFQPMSLSVEDPNLALHMGDRLPRMIEGPVGAPPPAWTVVAGGEVPRADGASCVLRDERRWSDETAAVRTVTVRVDAATGLPVAVSERWQGFGDGAEASLDRRFDVSLAYPEVAPEISAPAPDETSPNLSQGAGDPTLPTAITETRQTIVAPGVVSVNDADGPYARVEITEVIERRSIEDRTAAPGNVYLSFYSRHESLRDGPGLWTPSLDWMVAAHGGGEPLPLYLGSAGAPALQPQLRSAPLELGQILEGWVTYELPADGDVSMWFRSLVGQEARVILRQAAPESP